MCGNSTFNGDVANDDRWDVAFLFCGVMLVFFVGVVVGGGGGCCRVWW